MLEMHNDAEPGTPRPLNHVFCIDLRRQLINAFIANRLALAAILFHYCTTGTRCRGRGSGGPNL